MAHGRLDAEGSAGERARQLGDQLLPRVGLAREAALLVAVQPRAMPGPVAELVQGGAVEIDLLAEGLLRRHLHEIEGGRVIGRMPADPEVSAGRCDQRLGDRDGLALAAHGRRRRHRLGQAFALVDVEHGEPLQERDLPRLPILVPRPLLLALGREPVRIADARPLLALADIAASAKRLPEGQPALRRIAALDTHRPKDQNIDPRVAPAGHGIGGHGTAARGIVPGLHPGQPSLLQLNDHPPGHLGVDALAPQECRICCRLIDCRTTIAYSGAGCAYMRRYAPIASPLQCENGPGRTPGRLSHGHKASGMRAGAENPGPSLHLRKRRLSSRFDPRRGFGGNVAAVKTCFFDAP